MQLQLERLLRDSRVQSAAACARATDERTLQDQAELSGIAAPPFSEDERGRRMGELMADAGLVRVRTDGVGNVLADLPGTAVGPPLVMAAHLDTVFPADVDVTVSREFDLLRGPGISDDARGLAVLLAVARCLQEGAVSCTCPVLFAATVGEEALGDLRGVKHLFQRGEGRDASGFVSVDGAGLHRLVVKALGSRRFRITACGPGGHSWIDWGLPNPIHVLADVVSRLTRLELPSAPMTSLTVARWGGGKSINAIPQDAWLEIDTRSEADDHLADLERRIREVVDACGAAADPEGPSVQLTIEVLGHRPGGHTPSETPLLRAAVAATRHVGAEPLFTASSTDANVPMSVGIPAVTVGGGGEAGKAHTTEEWYRNTKGVEGVQRALYTLLLAAGVAG
jgi:acetylornithine deacetylase/succinyl-diaminopimelate desuccinylase-like protein